MRNSPLNRFFVLLLALLTRTFRNFRGRWWLMRNLLRQGDILRELGARVVRLQGIGTIEIEPGEHVGKHIFVDGVFDEDIFRMMKMSVASDDNVVDVGANIGYFTLALANLVPCGEVVSIEASPRTRAILERNIARNRLDNVTVIGCAASDAPGPAIFYEAADDNRGQSSLRRLSGADQEVLVDGYPLDSLLDRSKRYKLIKIDVEGAEAKVIRGAKTVIAESRPVIILEWSNAMLEELGDSSEELWSLLSDLGYRIYSLSAEGLSLTTKDELAWRQTNVVALPVERDALRRADSSSMRYASPSNHTQFPNTAYLAMEPSNITQPSSHIGSTRNLDIHQVACHAPIAASHFAKFVPVAEA